jgi:hypothetical protein
MKRWRWWIVPLILTIPFEVVAATGLALAQAPGSGQMVFWYSIRPYHGLYFAWPLFLGLVWPTALIIHGVWKGRKARKLGVFPQEALQGRHGGMQPPPRRKV